MMVEKGYQEDPYAALLYSGKRRKLLPIINRGTWVRAASVSNLLSRFISAYPGGQILSLGGGFDSNFFRLKAAHPCEPFFYFELDFPEIVEQKTKRIGKQEPLLNLAKSGGYSLAAADLRTLTPASLHTIGLDPDKPTLIVAEVVLVYLEESEGDALIQALADYFSERAFLIYEMICPDDPFGKMMMANLEDRGCPLRGIQADLAAQRKRYEASGGCECVVAVDMLEFYEEFVEKEERARVEALEFFDEYEEWQLLQRHYCVVFAATPGLAGLAP